MPLNIIGSGFGRADAMSTRMALEELGFGPCHHMVEVMGNPDQPAHWKALAEGHAVPAQPRPRRIPGPVRRRAGGCRSEGSLR